MTYEEFKTRYDFNMRDPQCILGAGGFGKVFKAYDNEQDRYVAIKRGEVKEEFRQFTLMREVELANAIPAHPNIAQYETCYRFENMDAEVDFAVLRYYEHGNISQLVGSKALNDLEKRQLIKGLLRGMVHLHSHGFIHRDMKGGNILVSRAQGVWQPKIADFGLSKEVKNENDTRSVYNSAIGVSYHYAAPEQITGASKILPNVDLWAIGVLIYQILTGEMPFYSKSPDTTINQNEVAKMVTNIVLPQKLSTLPEPYQSMIRQCWVKDPKKRVQKAAVLLGRLGENKKTPAPKPIPPAKPEKTILDKPESDPPPIKPKPLVANNKPLQKPVPKQKSKIPYIIGGAVTVVLLIALFVWGPWDNGRSYGYNENTPAMGSTPATGSKSNQALSDTTDSTLIMDTLQALSDTTDSTPTTGSTSATFNTNTIKTIKIGNQTWMAENLNLDVGYGCWCYDNKHSNCNKYGKLYTWKAAKRAADKILGWHLPTDEEWKQLEMYLGMSKSDANNTGWRGNISKKLKSTSGWTSGDNGNNSSGFSGLPGGFLYGFGHFYDMGNHAYFWTATAYDSGDAWKRHLDFNDSGVSRYHSYKGNGYSVRLVRD